jgi:hypothetical protein
MVHDGPGVGATIAARVRSRGCYRGAAIIEECYGERRTWGSDGSTKHEAFPTNFDPNSKGVVD